MSKTSDKKHNLYKIATIEFSEQEQKKLNKKASKYLFDNNEIYEINDIQEKEDELFYQVINKTL